MKRNALMAAILLAALVFVCGGCGSYYWDGSSWRPVKPLSSSDYTITLDPQGGSGGTESVTATYGSAMPAITAPALAGLPFGGYYAEAGGRGMQYYNADGTSAHDSGTGLPTQRSMPGGGSLRRPIPSTFPARPQAR